MSDKRKYVVNKPCFIKNGERFALCGMLFSRETNCWIFEEELTRHFAKDDFESVYNNFVNEFCKRVDIVVVNGEEYVVSFEGETKLLPA